MKKCSPLLLICLLTILITSIIDTGGITATVSADPLGDSSYEDFETYIEEDNANNDITVQSAVQVDGNTMTRTDTAYLYKDCGENHFDDFEHLHDTKMVGNAGAASSYAGIWGLSNTIGDIKDWSTDNFGICVFIWSSAINTPQLMLYESDGTPTLDQSINLVKDTVYYLTTKRVDTTLTCEIYSDAERTVSVDEMTLEVHTRPYRYLFPIVSYDTGTSGKSISVESWNLDIQEDITSNIPPTIEQESPSNSSSSISRYPTLSIRVNDSNGNQSTVYWSTNASGDWFIYQTNSSVLNATVYDVNFSNASEYSTTYYWRVSANDTHDNTTKTFHFTTESEPWANTPSTIEQESPSNSSSSISRYPTLSIRVNDSNGNQSTVYWSTNASGDWFIYQTNSSVLNATVYDVNFSNASEYSTTYYWRVSANDTHDNTTKTFHFTTESEPSVVTWYSASFGGEVTVHPWLNTPPTIEQESPSNSSSSISMYPTLSIRVNDSDGNQSTVYWSTNASGDWFIYQTNNSVLNATVYDVNFSNASEYSTTYYWRVSANDTHDNTTKTFHFTTISADPIDNDVWCLAENDGHVEMGDVFDVTFNITINEEINSIGLDNVTFTQTVINGTGTVNQGNALVAGSTVIWLTADWSTNDGGYASPLATWAKTLGTNNSAGYICNTTWNAIAVGVGYINFTDECGTSYGAADKGTVFHNGTVYVHPAHPVSPSATAFNETQINLSWTKGDGADRTVVVAKENSLPVNLGDGAVVYNNTGTSYDHDGLSAGEHWYYRFYSWHTSESMFSVNNVTADATSVFIWLDITNASWDIGNIVMGSSTWTNETGITFIADMDNCTINTDLKLQVTIGADWTAATSGNGPGADIYRLNASINNWVAEFQIVTASVTTISLDIAAGQNETFDLRFDAPTSSSSGDQQSITVTATLVEH